MLRTHYKALMNNLPPKLETVILVLNRSQLTLWMCIQTNLLTEEAGNQAVSHTQAAWES